MAVARTVSRSVLADQVRDRLLEGILDGHYPPDTRIIETQVARELGTSQAPVREALRALEGLGIVEITPFRGARVRRPSKHEIIEAYAVRSTLETLGARLAVPRMSDADVAELAGHLRAMHAAAADHDGHGVAEADARFHGRIVEALSSAHQRRVRQRHRDGTVERRPVGDGRQRRARKGLALARAVPTHLSHARRARCRPGMVGRTP